MWKCRVTTDFVIEQVPSLPISCCYRSIHRRILVQRYLAILEFGTFRKLVRRFTYSFEYSKVEKCAMYDIY